MPNAPTNLEADMELIDRLLAGTLGPEERRALEERMARDPELAREVRAQASVQASLSRAFPRPEPALVSAMLAQAQAELLRPPAMEVLRRLLPATQGGKVAALVVVCVGLLVAGAVVIVPRLSSAPRTLEAMLVAPGDRFAPTTPEEDPATLQAMIAEKIGLGVQLPRREGLRYLGVRTDLSPTPMGVVVLAIDGDRRVLLVLDRASPARPLVQGSAPVESGAGGGTVYRHAREESGAALVEYSQSATPLMGDVRILP